MRAMTANAGLLWPAAIAAALTLAVDGVYLAVIASEGEGQLTSSRVVFVAASLAATAGALLAALATERALVRAALLCLAAATLLTWTVLGALSIGILVLPAAVAAAAAAVRAGPSRLLVAACGASAVAIAALGLLFSS